MKVHELIELLSKCDREAEAVMHVQKTNDDQAWTEDLEISEIDATQNFVVKLK